MSIVAPNLTYLLDVTAWDPEETYYPRPYQGLQFTQYGMAVVTYQHVTYVMNNTAYPQQGVIPPSDTAWSVLGGGSSGGNFQGYWQAETNSPELENGTGTVGYYYINTSSGTHSVDFGAGLIAFNQNDSVAYGQDGAWYNAGQQGSIQNIITDTANQLAITNTDGTVKINAQTGVTQDKLVIVGAGDVIAQSILPVVSIAKGGTNSSTALTNSKIMGSVGGAIVEINSIPANIGVGSGTLTNPSTNLPDTLQNTVNDIYHTGTGVKTIDSSIPNVLSVNSTDPENVVLNFIPNNNKGLQNGASGLEVKVDGVTMDFNGSGQLRSIGTGTGIVQQIETDTPDALDIDNTDPALPRVNVKIDTDSGVDSGTNGIKTKIDNATIIYGTGGDLGKLKANVGVGINKIIQFLGTLEDIYAKYPVAYIGDSVSTDPISDTLKTLDYTFNALNNKIDAVGSAQQVVYGSNLRGNNITAGLNTYTDGTTSILLGSADFKSAATLDWSLSPLAGVSALNNISFKCKFSMFSGSGLASPITLTFDYTIYALNSAGTTLTSIATGSVTDWAFAPNKMYPDYEFITTATPSGTTSGQFILSIDNVAGQTANLQTLIQQIAIIPTVS